MKSKPVLFWYFCLPHKRILAEILISLSKYFFLNYQVLMIMVAFLRNHFTNFQSRKSVEEEARGLYKLLPREMQRKRLKHALQQILIQSKMWPKIYSWSYCGQILSPIASYKMHCCGSLINIKPSGRSERIRRKMFITLFEVSIPMSFLRMKKCGTEQEKQEEDQQLKFCNSG